MGWELGIPKAPQVPEAPGGVTGHGITQAGKASESAPGAIPIRAGADNRGTARS